MKPQITSDGKSDIASWVALQRSCGMKPQITQWTALDNGEIHACFKGAAA